MAVLRVGRAGFLAVIACSALGALHVAGWRSDRDMAQGIAARRPSIPPATQANAPRVSILVAAWNEAQHIARHVDSVLRLTYPNCDLILCAGGPDGTYGVAATALGDRGVLLRQEPGEGKQRALRRCLERATGDIVYLTDADCVLDDTSFLLTIRPLLDGAQASTGRSRPGRDAMARDAGLLCQWAPQYVAESLQADVSPGMLGRNCAVRRDVLLASGGFDAEIRTGTDYYLSRQLAQAGATIAFARWSFVETGMPGTVGAYVRQQSRWLRNHWIHGTTTGDRPAARHAVRTWIAGAVVCLLPLAIPLVGVGAWLPWLILVLHGGLARMRYVAFVATAERMAVPWRSLAISPLWFVIDAASWLRSLLDTVSAARRDRW